MEFSRVLLSTAYFPPIDYLIAYKQYEVFIEACENYQKKSIRNRSTILSANGPMTLSVPLRKGKTRTQIKDVEISYSEDWVKNHLYAIRSAYGAAPYFDDYFESIEQLLNQRVDKLFDLNRNILHWLQSLVDLKDYQETIEYSITSAEDQWDLRSFSFKSIPEIPSYEQVYAYKYGYIPYLSILDLIFNMGPETEIIIKGVNFKDT